MVLPTRKLAMRTVAATHLHPLYLPAADSPRANKAQGNAAEGAGGGVEGGAGGREKGKGGGVGVFPLRCDRLLIVVMMVEIDMLQR